MFKSILEQTLDPFSSEITQLGNILGSSWNVDFNTGHAIITSGDKSLTISYSPLKWTITIMDGGQVVKHESGVEFGEFQKSLSDITQLVQGLSPDSSDVVYSKEPEWSRAPGFAGRYHVKGKLPIDGAPETAQINSGPGVGTV